MVTLKWGITKILREMSEKHGLNYENLRHIRLRIKLNSIVSYLISWFYFSLLLTSMNFPISAIYVLV